MSALFLLVILPLLLMEFTEVSPWLARNLVKYAARRLPTWHTKRYTQEWLADLEEIPGKLSKLLWALGTLVAAHKMRVVLELRPQPIQKSINLYFAIDLSGENAGTLRKQAMLTRELARRAGLSGLEMHHAEIAAYVHDIGKRYMPDLILYKPGPLTYRERAVWQQHTTRGYDMAGRYEVPAPARLVIKHHHERWDGTGYPAGLKGEAIPILARIFMLVDVYIALHDPQPYKPGWSHERSLLEIQHQAGRQFDPTLTALFVEMMSELEWQTIAEQSEWAETELILQYGTSED